MKSLIRALLALTIILSVPVSAGEWSVVDDHEWCEGARSGSRLCEVREIVLPAWDDVDVETVNGSIRVEAWDRDQIEVVARIEVHGSSGRDAEKIVREVEIHAGEGGIYARGPRRRGGFLGLFGRREWSVSFRVRVPADVNASLETTNGSIRAQGVAGVLEFETTNGSVVVRDAGGDVHGGTTNGHVEIALDPSRFDGREVDVRTTNGGIEVGLPEDISARIDASTVNGGVGVDLPVVVEEKSRRRLRGRIGEGDVTLKARAVNGRIRFVRLSI